jgi:hypothetical protein
VTTPFEREILTHHYTSGAPFPRPTELYWATVNKFCDMGLLRRVPSFTDHPDGVLPQCVPLEMYMQALAAVPLPERGWVMPDSAHRSGKGEA